MADQRPNPNLRRVRPTFLRAAHLASVVIAMALVIGFYHWTVKSSGGFLPPGEEDYYNFLVRGWRSGHLYLSKAPRPELLALADPYDPAQNNAFRMGDASYYQGHYYLYFSGAPAVVLLLPYVAITGRELATTTAIFIFCTTGFLAACALGLAVRRRYFPASAWWLGPLVVLLLGVSTHVLVLQRRPLVWELPLSAGFAFSMLALLSVYWALHGRRPVVAMTLAGLSYGLAVASRPTCLFGSVLFVPVLWQLWPVLADKRQWWRCAIGVALGIGVFVVALLAHNYARFGNPLEFGINYQLSSAYEMKQRHFSFSYVAHNAYIYFCHPGSWSSNFPFVRASSVTGGPAGYLGGWVEPICGLFVTFPFLWGALALPLAWKGRTPERAAPLRALLVAITLFLLTVVAFYLTFYCATPRYMTDFTPSLTLLAAFAVLGLERWAQHRGFNRLVAPLIAILGLTTVAAGLAVNFDYHNRSLQQMQPDTWQALERIFGSLPPAAKQ